MDHQPQIVRSIGVDFNVGWINVLRVGPTVFIIVCVTRVSNGRGGSVSLAGIDGTVVAVVLAVWIANAEPVQNGVTSLVTLVSRLEPIVLPPRDFLVSVTTATVVVVATLIPLYKPRQRRILNVIYNTQRRVLIAGLALGAIGYFDYTYELPRATLLVTVGTLPVVLPA